MIKYSKSQKGLVVWTVKGIAPNTTNPRELPNGHIISCSSKQEVFFVAIAGSSSFLHFNWQTPEVIIRIPVRFETGWLASSLTTVTLPTSQPLLLHQRWMSESNGWLCSGAMVRASALARFCVLEFTIVWPWTRDDFSEFWCPYL